jgi:hypothetical protein
MMPHELYYSKMPRRAPPFYSGGSEFSELLRGRGLLGHLRDAFSSGIALFFSTRARPKSQKSERLPVGPQGRLTINDVRP